MSSLKWLALVAVFGASLGYVRAEPQPIPQDLAVQVIQLALHVPVINHDDRAGSSKYDLKILYPGGRAGAAEVVSTRDFWGNEVNPS